MKTFIGTILIIFSLPLGAQTLVDMFGDGDLSTNPEWRGDRYAFTDSLDQLMQSAPSDSSPVYISTQANWRDTCSWTILVNADLKLSASVNYVQIYLSSSSAHLDGPLNGYYIKIGSNGNSDALMLYRQDGSTKSKIAESAIATMGSETRTNTTRILVTRSSMGQWVINSDTSGGTNFTEEFRHTDNTYSNGTHFGVFLSYSSSNTQNFTFDDVEAGPLFRDTSPPAISRLDVLNNKQVRLEFSEPVDSTTAVNAQHYQINTQNVESVSYSGALPNAVVLTSAFTFTNGSTYGLRVNGVEDVNGNAAQNLQETFLYASSDFKDVLINEIFADPTPVVGLPDGEFVELYNPGTFDIDLDGWSFADQSSSASLPNFVLQAGAYVIICNSADEAAFAGYGDVIGLNLPTLNNGGDNLTLRNADGDVIDAVSYSSDWYITAGKSSGGYSLELINPLIECSGSGNWRASDNANGGTPGTQNSLYNPQKDFASPFPTYISVVDSVTVKLGFNEVLDSGSIANTRVSLDGNLQATLLRINAFPHDTLWVTFPTKLKANQAYDLVLKGLQDCEGNVADTTLAHAVTRSVLQPAPVQAIVINEIMADPSPVVGLPEYEFVELLNTTDDPISLENWELRDRTGAVTLPVSNLGAGEYLIICPNAAETAFSTYGNVLAVSMPSLNNSGDDLSLVDAFGNVVDQVHYTIDWYKDDDKDNGGYTLERRNPFLTCSSPLNWTASRDAKGGTPGAQNSVFNNLPDTDPPVLLDILAPNEDTLVLIFNEPLDSSSVFLAEVQVSGIGTANLVRVHKTDITRCVYHLPSALGENLRYDLEIKNLQDCEGNSLSQTFSAAVVYLVPEPAALFDVVIHEIMADPSPALGLPDAEYIELFNRSEKPISIENWQLSDGNDIARLPAFILLPGDYCVLTSTATDDEFPAGIQVLGISGMPGLNNRGERIAISNENGELIHFVRYSDDWYQDDEKAEGGYALEMIDADNVCAEMDNWRAAATNVFGTPGLANSAEETNSDNVEPSISSVFAPTANRVEVYFEEKLDTAQALNLGYYGLEGEVNAFSKASMLGNNWDAVALTTAQALQANRLYVLEIDQLNDCAQNRAEDLEATFALPERVDSFDIVLNEVLFDPPTGADDYVELVNRSNKYLDLATMGLAGFNDDGALEDINPLSTASALWIPGEYKVFGTDVAAMLLQYTVKDESTVFAIEDLPSLPNDAGELALVRLADSAIIDRLRYDENWHYSLLRSVDGVSLERVNVDAGTQNRANWHSASSAAGYGTPGYRNSQASDSAVATAGVSLSRNAFSPDDDGFEDFVQVKINLEKGAKASASIKVFSLNGQVVKSIANHEVLGTENLYKWDGTNENGEKVPLGPYIIWVEVVETAGTHEQFKLPVAVVTQF